MTPELLGLVIGGIVPALLYGVSNIFQKVSTNAGIGIGIYLFIVGISVSLVGSAFYLAVPDRTINIRSALGAGMMGLLWGVGAGAVSYSLLRYQAPLGKLVPLYNMNTLVAVLLALWIFSEWKEVNLPQLLAGSILIIFGGVLVARA